MPILTMYGDFIEQDSRWPTIRKNQLAFLDKAKAEGADVEVIDLPEKGVKGNSHLLMMDKNNLVPADMILEWLGRKDCGSKAQATWGGRLAPTITFHQKGRSLSFSGELWIGAQVETLCRVRDKDECGNSRSATYQGNGKVQHGKTLSFGSGGICHHRLTAKGVRETGYFNNGSPRCLRSGHRFNRWSCSCLKSVIACPVPRPQPSRL